MKKTIYIIGATTKIDRLNIDAFEAVEHFLHKQDYDVVKPHDLFDGWDQHSLTQNEHMVRRLYELGKCDAVIVLPGYSECSFSRAEYNHARKNCMSVTHYEHWLKVQNVRKVA